MVGLNAEDVGSVSIAIYIAMCAIYKNVLISYEQIQR